MSSKIRYQKAKFVTLLSALINTLLGMSKLVGGFYFRSNALIADGFHSLSDLFTDAMVLIASKYGSLEADDTHPYGHRRIETAATYVLALLLIFAGLGIAWEALTHLRHPPLEPPNIWAIPVAALSIIMNEILFWYTRHVGKSIESQLIIANAWHHRSDATASIVVLIGLLGTFFGYPALDILAAFLVGLLISKMGLTYGLASIKELVDTGVETTLRHQIIEVIQRTDGVDKVHQLRTRRMGSDIFVDVHVQVSPMISVSEGHFIAQHVHQNLLLSIQEIKDVTVHIDPEDDEVSCPSSHLPNRNTLEKTMFLHWRQRFPEIKSCVLHYLDGTLTIDLIGHFDETVRQSMRATIEKDIKQLNLTALCIRIQPPAETLYEML